MPPADSRFPAAPPGRISRLISLAAGPPYRKSFWPEREVVSLQRKILVDGRVLDQFEFGCAPRVAPDTTVSPRRPLLRVYRRPVRAALYFGGRSGLRGRKGVIFSAFSSARPQSSAIFPEPAASGDPELSQEARTSPRTQDAEQ